MSAENNERPINLGLLVHTFDFGGLERCVARLVNHLDPKHIKPVLICMKRTGNAAQWIERDVEIVEVRKKEWGNDVRAPWKLARVLKDHAIDVLHSHNWGTIVEAAIARRIAGTKLHIHAQRGMDIPTTGQLKKFLRRKVFRWALRRADAVLAVAHSVKEQVSSIAHLQAEAISVIPNGVDELTPDAGARQRLRDELGISQDQLVVGSVGRLAKVKGFDSAIRAMCEMKERDAHLILVGDGGQQDSLSDLARSLNVTDRVHLVGRQENVADWLSSFDIYLNSSLSEGMSQSILEAMSVGLPSVVTDVGDNRVLVSDENECGLVVPAQEPAQLAAAIQQLAQGDGIKKYGDRAKQRFEERYTVDEMVRRYEDYYDSLWSTIS